ncbi:MAG: hypothetical protein CMI55_02360 [Parcubacteria group bacterium]|nr:hypothetical protein [Parcubacteria group bacterium]|tara:strand:- start:759 stop:992 length:234 start_codon:yes stop_codon:yes gene_type:complete
MLINGKLSQGESLYYLGYDMFVALCLLFGGGNVGVVLVQMALTAYCIFKGEHSNLFVVCDLRLRQFYEAKLLSNSDK